MGNSTISVQDVVDEIAVMGDVSPQANPSGYGPRLVLKIANSTMRDMIAAAFNWKWNSKIARPFPTNTWQQDYPQIGLTDLGWLEAYWWVDINSTILPKPTDPGLVDRDLPVCSQWGTSRPARISWRYNKQCLTGTWPGAGQVYTPLIGVTTLSNPLMAIIDKNGNLLVLTQFGTTGSTAPFLPAASAEGATVADGTCVWTVAGPDSQGIRIFPMPPAAGPVYTINFQYQMRPPTFTDPADFINPIPDDYSNYFTTGFIAYSYQFSPDANLRAQADGKLLQWKAAMLDAAKQGAREPEGFGLIPAANPVAPVYGRDGLRNPQNPLTPY